MTRESRTVDRSNQVDSSTQRYLPLVDLLVDTRAELMELAVASGLKVLTTMLEEDRTAFCGPRYQHQADRTASRAGTRVERSGPRRPQGCDSPASRAGPGPGSHAADVSSLRRWRSAESSRGGADAARRRDAAVW